MKGSLPEAYVAGLFLAPDHRSPDRSRRRAGRKERNKRSIIQTRLLTSLHEGAW